MGRGTSLSPPRSHFPPFLLFFWQPSRRLNLALKKFPLLPSSAYAPLHPHTQDSFPFSRRVSVCFFGEEREKGGGRKSVGVGERGSGEMPISMEIGATAMLCKGRRGRKGGERTFFAINWVSPHGKNGGLPLPLAQLSLLLRLRNFPNMHSAMETREKARHMSESEARRRRILCRAWHRHRRHPLSFSPCFHLDFPPLSPNAVFADRHIYSKRRRGKELRLGPLPIQGRGESIPPPSPKNFERGRIEGL